VTPSLRSQVLREWRPLAVTDSADAKAASLNKLVPGVMKRLGLEQRLQQSQVFYLWREIVGADIAKHAQPISLRNGVLILVVDHPIWLQELSRYHKSLLIQKIKERVGKNAVRNLVFRIG
jgi:predicted nucleic acid-binding Zn ribbon protein